MSPDDRLQVLADGLLLGGVFTMVHSVGMSLSGSQSVTRFVVVSVALVTTVAVGYLRFARRTTAAAPEADAGTILAGDENSQPSQLAERVQAIEATLQALAAALRRGQN